MAMVSRQINLKDVNQEAYDLEYWMSLSATERLKELYSLKQMNWASKDKPYPKHMEKVAEKKIKTQTDEDDF